MQNHSCILKFGMENVMKFRWALYKTKVKTKSNDPFITAMLFILL